MNKRKSVLAIILAFALILAMLGGCGAKDSGSSGSSSSGSSGSASQGSTEKVDDTVYEATLVVQETADDDRIAKAAEAEVRRLYEASNGRLKITISPNASGVSSPSDIYDSVRSGLVEMGMQSSSRVAGYFPLTDVLTLPGGIAYPGATQMGVVACALYEQVPEIQQEFDGVKVISFNSTAATMLFSIDNIVNKPADLKGKLIRGGGTYALEAIEALGASAVTLAPGEWADGAVKGVYDLNVSNYAALVTFAMADLFKYAYDYSLQTSYFVYVVNEDFYNSLPADLQALLSWENMGYDSAALYGGICDAAEDTLSSVFFDNGGTVITPSAADIAELDKITESVKDSWLKTASDLVGEARAQEILDLFYDLCAEYAAYDFDYQAVLDEGLALPKVGT